MESSMKLNSGNKGRVLIFSAAFIIIFSCSGSAAFSVFVEPLIAATGATRSEVTLTLTIYQFFMSLFGIISGKIVDKTKPKILMYIGGLVFGAGWILTSFSNSLFMLYLSYGVIAGAGNGLLYNPSINIALRWYPEKKGSMSGILLGAASLGPLVLAKFGALLCNSFGTSGLIYIGLIYLILVWAVSWKIEVPEKGWTPKGWAPPSPGSGNAAAKEYTPGEMIRTGRFWLLLLIFSIACTAGIMMIGTLSTIAQVQLGMTAVAASNMVAINCVANLAGRLSLGRLCDKWGETKTLALIFVLTIIGLAGLRFSQTQVLFILFLIILGGAFGGVLVVYPPLNSKTFGVKNSGVNYGIMFFGYSIGSFVGPQIAAQFVNNDLGAAAYSNVYLIAIGVAALGFLLNLVLIRNKSRR